MNIYIRARSFETFDGLEKRTEESGTGVSEVQIADHKHTVYSLETDNQL